MFPYIPHTSSDEQEMLQTIGLETTDQLFDDIPDDMRLKKALDLPTAKSELEVRNYLKSLADKKVLKRFIIYIDINFEAK